MYLLKGDPECKFKTFQDLVMFYCANKSHGNPTMPLLRLPDDMGPDQYPDERPVHRHSAPMISGSATLGRQPQPQHHQQMSGSATLGRPSSAQAGTMGRGPSAQSSTMSRSSQAPQTVDLGAIFQPTLTREKAEALVLKGPVGTFVIRNSSIQDSYSLIIHAKPSGDRRFYSPLIIKEFVSNKITFHVKGEEGNRFTSLFDLASYYSKNRSPVHPPMPLLLLPGQQPSLSSEEFGFGDDFDAPKTATIKTSKSGMPQVAFALDLTAHSDHDLQGTGGCSPARPSSCCNTVCPRSLETGLHEHGSRKEGGSFASEIIDIEPQGRHSCPCARAHPTLEHPQSWSQRRGS